MCGERGGESASVFEREATKRKQLLQERRGRAEVTCARGYLRRVESLGYQIPFIIFCTRSSVTQTDRVENIDLFYTS